MTAVRIAVLLCAVVWMLPAQAAEQRADLQHCTTCHGSRLQGNIALLAPALAGIEPWYLQEQLQAFQQQHRGKAGFDADPAGKEMQTVARQIVTAAQRSIASAYVAGYATARPGPTLPQGDAAQGAKLWTQHCASCHGSRDEGSQALHAPALRRLNDWYLNAAWRKFQQGLRGSSADAGPWALGMGEIARALPPDFAIQDVITFLANTSSGAAPP